MNRVTVLATKILIVVLIAAMAGFQIIMTVVSFGSTSSELPEGLDFVVWACIFGFVLCVEVVLVCVWRLVTLAGAARIFNSAAFTWVNVALAAVLVATALTALTSVTLAVTGEGVPPGVPVAGTVLALFGLGLSLVIVVMRALLRQATTLEHELAEVV